MTYLKNSLPVIVPSLLSTLLFVPGCYSKPLRVKYGESHSISELLHVHDSPVTWLSVGAKKYEYIMGNEPYYVKVPGRTDIFFITSNQRQSEFVYHFVSLEDGNEVSIPTDYTTLWIAIGSTAPTSGHISFEIVDGPKIVILRKREGYWRRYSFDLEKKMVAETEGK